MVEFQMPVVKCFCFSAARRILGFGVKVVEFDGLGILRESAACVAYIRLRLFA